MIICSCNVLSDDEVRSALAAQGMGRVSQLYGEIVAPIHVATTYERDVVGSYPGGRIYSRGKLWRQRARSCR